MSARFPWVVQDTSGNGVPGQTVKLHRKSDGAEIGTFTDDGNGNYHYDHNISEKVIVKVNGVTVTPADGVMHVADDLPISGNLASTETGKGASLIGIEDPDARFSGTNVEAALAEIKTALELASTAAGKGASLVGLQDSGGYYSSANLEAALAEIGAVVSLLDGLTATAAELNKLDGAGAGVTAVNLNILTAGDQSDAYDLHSHDMSELLGNVLTNFDGGPSHEDMDLILRPGYTDQYGIGDLVFDVVHTDIAGKAQIRKFGLSEQDVILTEIMTTFEIGDLNFSGSPVIGSVQNPGKVTNALKLLANYAMNVAGASGFTRQILWVAGTSAGAADGNTAADPDTTTLWMEKTATTFKLKRSFSFMQTPDMKYLRLRYNAKVQSGGSGLVKLAAASGINAASLWDTITETVFTGGTITLDLGTSLPVSSPTKCTLGISMQANGTHQLEMNSDVEVWVEK